MINRERMVKEFLDITAIDSLSKRERGVADELKNRLAELGFQSVEDGAADAIGGTAGNIICRIPGKEGVPALMFGAHMDTVEPGIGKVRIVDGDYIRTDGTTILGADNVAGIVSILEAVRDIKESNAEHGDIYVVFTVAEEGGLFGAKNLDLSQVPAKYGFIMDGGGSPENCIVKAPYQSKGTVRLVGKAAHAGVAPEEGINAIQVLADAISNMKLGRIDFETTANIGIIKGGMASNTVCETVDMVAEARSARADKMEAQLKHMQECFDNAAEKFAAKCEFDIKLAYPGYDIGSDSEICRLVKKSGKKIGLESKFIPCGGGTDANILNSKGVVTVVLGVGTEAAHTVNEYLYVPEMVKASELLVSVTKTVTKG